MELNAKYLITESSLIRHIVINLVCIPFLTGKSYSFRRLRCTSTTLTIAATVGIDNCTDGAFSAEIERVRELRETIRLYSEEDWQSLLGHNGRVAYLRARERVEELLHM